MKKSLILLLHVIIITSIVFCLSSCNHEKANITEKGGSNFDKSEKMNAGPITANKGGSFPTAEPLTGMDSPLICKLELAGLHSEAEKIGAKGILTLDRYDPETKACSFAIRKTTAMGDLGMIHTLHQVGDERYGIRLEIEKSDTDQIRLWTEAALFFFNNGIDEKTALDSFEQAISTGSSSSALFEMKVSDSVRFEGTGAKSVKVIEITSISE